MRYSVCTLFTLLLLIMFSCDNDDKQQGASVIMPSTKNIEFWGFRDTATVTTQGNDWWVYAIQLDGVEHVVEYANADIEKRRVWKQTCEWLTLERNHTKLDIIVPDNSAFVQRTFAIVMKTKTGSDTIYGLQQEPWDGPNPFVDYFKLSATSVAFETAGGTANITSEETGWWIDQVVVDGNTYVLTADETEQFIFGQDFTWSKTYDFLTIVVKPRALTLTVTPNTSGGERSFEIGLQSGDAFTRITGTQAR